MTQQNLNHDHGKSVRAMLSGFCEGLEGIYAWVCRRAEAVVLGWIRRKVLLVLGDANP